MRLAALFLLLFVVFDLSSTCNCQDEAIDLGGGTTSLIAAAAPGQGAGNSDFSHEWFCCCQHIRPEGIVHTTIDLPFVELTTSAQVRDLKVAPASLYHPPRSIAL